MKAQKNRVSRLMFWLACIGLALLLTNVGCRTLDEDGEVIVVGDTTTDTTTDPTTDVTPPPAEPLVYDFEGSLEGWTPTGQWHGTTRRKSTGVASAWYGDETNLDYYVAGSTPHSGSLTSPPVTLAASGAKIEFDYFLHVSCADDTTVCATDGLWVEVSMDAGATWTTVDSSIKEHFGAIPYPFAPRSVDLASYAGQSVQIRFYFYADGVTDTGKEGAYIDNVKIF